MTETTYALCLLGLGFSFGRLFEWFVAPHLPLWRGAAKPEPTPAFVARRRMKSLVLIEGYSQAPTPDPWDEIEIIMAMNERLNSTLH